jgi:hypothetical protein
LYSGWAKASVDATIRVPTHTPIDADPRGLDRLPHGHCLLPHPAPRRMQPINPLPGRNVEVKDHQLDAFRDADVDVGVGRRRAEGGGVMDQVDSKEARRSFGDHSDELLCARRRLDGVP